jgi:L-alanine-DL-glutamate epimerase-like enolase superfamily enzyme
VASGVANQPAGIGDAGLPLEVRRAEYFLVRIPLRFAVRHALAERAENITGFLVLGDEEGRLGIGEFLPREYVTGETLDDCLKCLRQLAPEFTVWPISDPVVFLDCQARATAAMRGVAALGALELALLDLWGKRSGRPVAQLLRAQTSCDGTDGSLSTGETAIYSAVYPLASGWKRRALHLFYRTLMRMEQLKLKGTGRIEADLAHVQAVRRAYRWSVAIRLDLNGSLAPEHAEVYFSRMLEADVRWFEQPFPKEDLATVARFQREFASELVLCGDESVCTMEDLERSLSEGAFRAVNLRIGKHGGLLPALRIYRRAVESGLATQLGCLVGETSVLAYAGLHFAALARRLRFREGCFGRYLVRWDVIQPSLTFSWRGRVPFRRLPAAGLAPSFDLERLRRHAFETGSLV